MKAAAAGVVALVAAMTAPARADTPLTVWDMAKSPKAFEEARLHARIEPHIELYNWLFGIPRDIAMRASTEALDDVRMILEDAGVRAPATELGPWLRYDLAWTLLRQGQYTPAVPILEGLAQYFDNAAFSQDVWERLADAYVHLERTPDEIHSYDEVLARATTDSERLTPLLNQGEALMRSGDAEAAVPQFREVLHLTAMIPNSNDIDMLAEWDLAVALDRSGDAPLGLETARSAVRADRRCVVQVATSGVLLPTPPSTSEEFVDVLRQLLHEGRITLNQFSAAMRHPEVRYVVPPGLFSISDANPSVYFVPEYEREWYLALGYEAIALDDATPRAAAEDLGRAKAHLSHYVDMADLHGGDKWLDLGKKRLETLRKRADEARKRAGITDVAL